MTDPFLLPAFLASLCAASAVSIAFIEDDTFICLCFGALLVYLAGYVLMGIA